MPTQSTKWREDALQLGSQIGDLAQTLGKSQTVTRTQSLVEQLQVTHSQILVLGRFNSGKTSLINGLLGLPLLPISPIPNTRLMTRVLAGEQARISLTDHETQQVTTVLQGTNDLKTIARAIDQTYQKYDSGLHTDILNVEYPLNAAFENISVFDTPGLGISADDLFASFMDVLPLVDAVIVAISSQEALTMDEMDLIQRRMWEKGLQNLFFAITKSDLIEEAANRELVFDRVRSRLSEALNMEPRLYRVSNKQNPALVNQIADLRHDLLSFVGSDEASVSVLENATGIMQVQLHQITQDLRARTVVEETVPQQLSAVEAWSEEDVSLNQKPEKLEQGLKIVDDFAQAVKQQPPATRRRESKATGQLPYFMGDPEADMIFISYKHDDWNNYVRPLITRLYKEGFRVWVDRQSLVGGGQWMHQVEKALAVCNRMILCVTPEALASRFVDQEWRYFYLKNKPFYPVVMREPDELPPALMLTQYVTYGKAGLDQLIKYLQL